MPPDPDQIEAGKLRYLATFNAPPEGTHDQNSYGRSEDAPKKQFQAWVGLEEHAGVEFVSADQVQANVVYLVTMRWGLLALALRASWQLVINWPGPGTAPVTRTFELQEPPRDPTGRRRKLTFRVKESTKATGG
jgi:hypothetical protein